MSKNNSNKGGGQPALDTLPANSPEAEQAVLGCILLSPQAVIPQCVESFQNSGGETFYDPRYRTIYDTAAVMHKAGEAVDIITLQQRLKDAGELERIGGVAFLVSCQDQTPSAANLEHYTSGGATVGTSLAPAIQLLMNRVSAIPLGAKVFSGLKNNFAIPRVQSNVTPQSLSEIAGLAQSDILFDQEALKPLRMPVQVKLSTQLVKQTDGGAEEIIRTVIRNAIGVKIDQLIYLGQGGNSEPVGIFNTPGVGVITYGGAATWAKILAAEKALADMNADSDALGWVVTPATRNAWKQASKIAATNFPQFLFESGSRVNDYPAIATNQLAANNQTVFGNFAELWILIWGDDIEIITDSITQGDKGKTVITAVVYWNFLLNHPQSFCVSTDSGAQ
jgi:HK97 family phage major capsid protein